MAAVLTQCLPLSRFYGSLGVDQGNVRGDTLPIFESTRRVDEDLGIEMTF